MPTIPSASLELEVIVSAGAPIVKLKVPSAFPEALSVTRTLKL